MRVDSRRIEVVDHQVAAVLRLKSGMERLRIAHEVWEVTRDRLQAFFSARHPDLDHAQIQRLAARRLLGDPG